MEEVKAWRVNGFLGVIIISVFLALGAGSFFNDLPILGVIFVVIAALLASGVTIIQPNQSVVVTFFGRYRGSIRESGLFMTVPLATRKTISLRVRNFNSKKLKVNDVEGNPIEIAAVIVFKVVNSAKAVYDVDDYKQFVEIQSETAIRHIASQYPYDNFDDDGLSLRGNAPEVSEKLKVELQDRLSVAGVEVIETRLTHLAYSTEIAQAMLQRQQAAAIISARRKIVEGAVGMAQDAVEQLSKDEVIELDEERRVNMVNNLMVAIVSDKGAQPVINAGSLY